MCACGYGGQKMLGVLEPGLQAGMSCPVYPNLGPTEGQNTGIGGFSNTRFIIESSLWPLHVILKHVCSNFFLILLYLKFENESQAKPSWGERNGITFIC